MKVTFIFFLTIYIKFLNGADLDSYEINRIEFTPLHDAIILNDIVDILNEFENSVKPQFEHHMFSNSESDEDVENLLLEYQQYLDKAHEQRLNYIKKSKDKNKVPLLRYEKFNKLKPAPRNIYGGNNNYYLESMKLQPTALLNTFMPINSNMKVLKKTEDLFDTSKSSYGVKKSSNLLNQSGLSSCICNENVIPCKQCFTEPVLSRKFNLMTPFTNHLLQTSENGGNPLDNNLNIRVKIDIQLPNISMLSKELKYRNQDMTEEHEDAIPKETLSMIDLPLPYLNFSIPMELIGYKHKTLSDKSSPLHKITIHKKKKFRIGNNNRKHKNKKPYSLHNFNFDPQIKQNTTMRYNNSLIHKNNTPSNNEKQEVFSKTNPEKVSNFTSNVINTTPQYSNLSNQSAERIYLTINITTGNDSLSENVTKIENSIETDFVNDKDNISSTRLLRLKREITSTIIKTVPLLNNNKTTTTLSPVYSQPNLSHVIKETELDVDLLYWPFANKNKSLISSKNITALILDREIKKAKLNMTTEKIRSNHTTALEKAIFGDVDWNDVDAVVPVFMSFVGKYLTGVLTFCSQNLCHSMKCEKKICMHRICTADYRYNNKGHCVGNNDTDSVATMESIMDLPSNIAFEVVDILQEKMIGKLFGKGTLCINAKCNTFAAFKKSFKKSKCTFKDLNLAGHCPNVKNVKTL